MYSYSAGTVSRVSVSTLGSPEVMVTELSQPRGVAVDPIEGYVECNSSSHSYAHINVQGRSTCTQFLDDIIMLISS